MSYRILLSPKADNFLKKLDRKVRERIQARLFELSENPGLGKPLVGRLSGLWSLRVGDYRVIYKIRNSEIMILVLKIGHRKNVY